MADSERDTKSPRVAASSSHDSHTRLVALGERVRPGAAAVVDGNPQRLEELASAWSSATQAEAFTAQNLDGIRYRLRKPRDGRPRVRGFLLHWKIQGGVFGNALDAVEQIRPWYPRTPICVFGNPSVVRVDLRFRPDLQLVEAAQIPADRIPSPPALRAAYVGVLRIEPGCSVPLLDEALVTSEVVLECERELYGPWDEHCRRVRRWLLGRVTEGEKLEEYHLRTLDAYFESIVDPTRLAIARGVDPTTLEQYVKEIRRVTGSEMASLKAQWEIEFYGQGAPMRSDPLVRRPRPLTPSPNARPPRARR